MDGKSRVNVEVKLMAVLSGPDVMDPVTCLSLLLMGLSRLMSPYPTTNLVADTLIKSQYLEEHSDLAGSINETTNLPPLLVTPVTKSGGQFGCPP